MFRTLIIGLGNIGFKYDKDLNRNEYILSHASAITSSDDFELVGGVDPLFENREDFSKLYSAPVFESIESALDEIQPDVVIISSPTDYHLENIQDVLNEYQPKVILCEKPLARNTEEGEKILALCQKNNVSLFLNYMRRSDPGVQEIKKRIQSGEFGTFFKGNVWYSKGFVHNGSHMFNLVESWLGNMNSFKIINLGRDYPGYGPEPDVWVQFENGSVVFQSAWEEHYSHYVLELVSDKGRLRFERSGSVIEWQPVTDHPLLPNYKVLSGTNEQISSDMNMYQRNVLNELNKALNGKSSEISDGEDGFKTLKSMESILKEL